MFRHLKLFENHLIDESLESKLYQTMMTTSVKILTVGPRQKNGIYNESLVVDFHRTIMMIPKISSVILYI